MNEHDIAEVAFNNGYEKGYADATDNNVGKFLPAGTKMFIEACERSLANNGTGREMRFVGGDVVPLLANQVASSSKQLASKWIPVTERLPEVGQRILVYCESKTIEMHITTCTYMAGRFGSKQFSRHVRNVTHWMPLPEPPEEV